MGEGAFGHRFRRLAAHRTELLERVVRHAKHLLLGFVRVGDEAAVDENGRARNFGERSSDQPARAGLRRHHRQPFRLVEIEQSRAARPMSSRFCAIASNQIRNLPGPGQADGRGGHRRRCLRRGR